MPKKYDIHLSAYSITRASIQQFENLGFERDLFANNTRCETTQYHATYRGKLNLPDDFLWVELCQILKEDKIFAGSLEEEIFETTATIHINSSVKIYENIVKLPKIQTTQPIFNEYKACDIHININTELTLPKTMEYIESLEVASFDREEDGQLHRIFTITCSTTADGILILNILKKYLENLQGLVGKIKMERTSRHLRLPLDSPQLPLTNSKMVKDWSEQIKAITLL